MANRRGIPSYRKHKATGQGVVTIDGSDRYLGKHGTDASRRAYDKLIGEWLVDRAEHEPPDARPMRDLTVSELVLAYSDFAEEYYRDADGNPQSSLAEIRYATDPEGFVKPQYHGAENEADEQDLGRWNTSGTPAILERLDVLIAGRYARARHVGDGLLGSSNQAIHLLTRRYRPADFSHVPAREIILHSDGSTTISGISPWQPPGLSGGDDDT